MPLMHAVTGVFPGMASRRMPRERGGGVSPSLRTHKRLAKPWHARAKRDGVEVSLGYYGTRAEAENVEDEFNQRWPRRGSR